MLAWKHVKEDEPATHVEEGGDTPAAPVKTVTISLLVEGELFFEVITQDSAW